MTWTRSQGLALDRRGVQESDHVQLVDVLGLGLQGLRARGQKSEIRLVRRGEWRPR